MTKEEAQIKKEKTEAQTKADKLSEQLGVTVHTIIFQEEKDGPLIVGFIKEPSRMVKLAVLDKSVMGGFSAAAEMLDTVLLKQESDPRIYSERSEDDKIYLGAVMAAYDLVKFSVNTLKKK
ncbi:MAG: hypothetical protein M3Z26_00560 [Bacteroidota bacterium]|nr:hypothetical protein [Bacteroidota bacterium]